MESQRGRLLIAGPALWDPNFRRTIVLIGDHDEEGAVGVVLNRPSESAAAEILPALASLVAPGDPLFLGGPVEPQSAVVLAEFADADVPGLLAFGRVGFLTGEVDEDEVRGTIVRARVFAGYAGWGPGQLEAEMTESAWISEPALVEDVFHTDADALWSRVLRRKGGRFALMATMPVDPSLN